MGDHRMILTRESWDTWTGGRPSFVHPGMGDDTRGNPRILGRGGGGGGGGGGHPRIFLGWEIILVTPGMLWGGGGGGGGGDAHVLSTSWTSPSVSGHECN